MIIHVISFSKPVTYTSNAGVTFDNVTSGETGVAPAAGSGTDELHVAYDVTWVTRDPLPTDEIVFNYDAGTGNYVDADSNALGDQTLTLQSCPDAPYAFDTFESMTNVDEGSLITSDSFRRSTSGHAWLTYQLSNSNERKAAGIVTSTGLAIAFMDLQDMLARPARIQGDMRNFHTTKGERKFGLCMRCEDAGGGLVNGIAALIAYTGNTGIANIGIYTGTANIDIGAQVAVSSSSADIRNAEGEMPEVIIEVEDNDTTITARVLDASTRNLIDPNLEVTWTVSPVGFQSAFKDCGVQTGGSNIEYQWICREIRVYDS